MLNLMMVIIRLKHSLTFGGNEIDSKGMCTIICRTLIMPHRYYKDADLELLSMRKRENGYRSRLTAKLPIIMVCKDF